MRILRNFDDILAIIIVILLLLLARTNNDMFFFAILGCCLIRINKPLVILPGYLTSSLATGYFDLSNGAGVGRYYFIIVVISLIIYRVQNNTSIFQDRYFVVVLILIIASFISELIGPVGNFVAFMMIFQGLLVFLLLQGTNGLDLKHLLALVCVAFGLISLWFLAETLSNSAFLFVQRYEGGEDYFDGNRISIMLEQCGALCIACFFYYKNYFLKAILLVCVVACAFVIILTGSRTGLIALLAAIVFAVILSIEGDKMKILVPLLAIMIVGYIGVEYLSSIDSPILDRFSLSNVQESGGSGRSDGIKVIMTKFFPEHILFGSGIGGANMLYYSSMYGIPNLCHNIVFDPLSQLGVIIYSMFLYLLIPAGKRVFKLSKNYSYYSAFIILFLAVCVNGIGETIFYEKYFWNDLALCLLCCNYNNIP